MKLLRSGFTSEQDIVAQSLGYKDYDHYRASALWRKIKGRILERDNSFCRCCGGRAELVHHRSYTREVLMGNDDDQLVSICNGCHDFIHFKDDPTCEHSLIREWRSREETEKLLLEGRHETGFPAPKYDLRREHTSPRYPEGWSRMSSLQQSGWLREYDRQACLRRLQKYADNSGWVRILSQRLRDDHEMDESEISRLVLAGRAILERKTAKKRKDY